MNQATRAPVSEPARCNLIPFPRHSLCAVLGKMFKLWERLRLVCAHRLPINFKLDLVLLRKRSKLYAAGQERSH